MYLRICRLGWYRAVFNVRSTYIEPYGPSTYTTLGTALVSSRMLNMLSITGCPPMMKGSN